MLKMVAFLGLLYLLGAGLLGSRRRALPGALPAALAVVLGVPVAIALACLLLALGALDLTWLAVLAGGFVLAVRIMPAVVARLRGRARPALVPGPQSIRRAARRPLLNWAAGLFDLVVLAGICLATFHARQRWLGPSSPDVWAHIRWAEIVAQTRAHGYDYMPGSHVLVWLVTRTFGCGELQAVMQLPVMQFVYLGLAAYSAGAYVLNRSAGLMLAVALLAAPILYQYDAGLFLPRHIGPSLLLLGLLLAADGLWRRPAQTRAMLGSGVAIGAAILVHLGWEEILQCAALGMVLVAAAAHRRWRLKPAAIVVLTAAAVAGPFLAKIFLRKAQPGSHFNLTTGKLLPLTGAMLHHWIWPAIVWLGAASLAGFLLARLAAGLARQTGQLFHPPRLRKAALLSAVWAATAGIALALLLCVGKARLETLVFRDLPLPHPVNTERCFFVLAFALMGGAAAVGFLPDCLRHACRTSALVAVAIALAVLIGVPMFSERPAGPVRLTDIKGQLIGGHSVIMWLLLSAGVVVVDNRSLLRGLRAASKWAAPAVVAAVAGAAFLAMPSTGRLREYATLAKAMQLPPTPAQKWIIRNTDPDAVIVSHWPGIDRLEHVLKRPMKDGLLGPRAMMSLHRCGLPRRYRRALAFRRDTITGDPAEVARALAEDFGPKAFLYFRQECAYAFVFYREVAGRLNVSSPPPSREFFGEPPVEHPRARLRNMIRYFRSHPRHFRRVYEDRDSTIFDVLR